MNKENPTAIIDPILASSELRICIDGLRSPHLLDELQAREKHVTLIALDCPIEQRFGRIYADQERQNTHRTRKTLEEFRADEMPDYTNPDPNLPNMETMMARADHRIDASQPLDSVIAELGRIVSPVGNKPPSQQG